MTHCGLLLLFPIDKQYDYIVEKHFEIFFKKNLAMKIELSENALMKILTMETLFFLYLEQNQWNM